jgi:GxxExxY protein
MNADSTELIDAELTGTVIGVFNAVYNGLGPGFLESVYRNSMFIALRDAGLDAMQQVPSAEMFHGSLVGEFRADLLVSKRLVIELKSVSQILPAHEAQLVNYLQATGLCVGLILNFGPTPQFKRRVSSQSNALSHSSAPIRIQVNV